MRGCVVALSVGPFLSLLVGACANTVGDAAGSNASNAPNASNTSNAAAQTRAATAAAAVDSDAPFKVLTTLTSGDQTVANAIVFIGDYAADMRGDDPLQPAAVVDLKHEAWTDLTSGRHYTLAAVQAWEQEWRRDFLEGRVANVTDRQTRDLLRDVYDPHFEVVPEADGWIRFKSMTYDYLVRPGAPLPDGQRARFFKYARIQAYRRAIANGEPPPLAQLRVNDELAKRRIVPAELRIVVDQKARWTQVDVVIRVMPLTELESAAIKFP